MSYGARQKKLIKFLADESLDSLLIKKKENIAYLAGIRGEDALLTVSRRGNFLITDPRYGEEYKKNPGKCPVKIAEGKNPAETAAEICAAAGLRRIGFEANVFSYGLYAALKKRLAGRKLIPLAQAVEKLRMVKDNDEIRCIRQACRYGARLMNYATEAAKPGITEKTLKHRIEAYALKSGIALAGFDLIAASGSNASMPHAAVSDRVIRAGEMVTVDLGAAYLGYNSDLTRTVFLGRINRKYLHIYEIVLAAQKIAFESAKPGVCAKDIDAVSRRYISNKGMGSFFIHSLGHGIGRETHEIPAISRNSEMKLKKDMVITIEPGIYIPGWGGVRIEDTVLITKSGCEILTKGAMKYAGRN